MGSHGWTAEQIKNAMTYGLCWTCHEPRESLRLEEVINGRTEIMFDIVCPNGHDQGKWLEFDQRPILEDL